MVEYTAQDGSKPRIREHVEKVKLRLWTYRFWKQQTILDLFAGMGYLSEEYAKAEFEKLICVEKDEEYFNELRRRMEPFSNCVLIHDDNLSWLKDELPKVKDVTFVDFDPFGCPNEQIRLFFENYPVDRAIMVNVTDGVILNLRRLASVNLEKYLLSLYPTGRLPREEFKSKQELNRLLPWLQRTFINLLAAKHGFSTSFVYHAMNREANVTYYGFIAYPDVKTGLWATGKTSLIHYRKDEESLVKTLMKLIKQERGSI